MEKHGSHKTGTKEESYTFRNLPDTTTYSTLKMKAVDEAGNPVETETITVATKKVNKPYVGDYVNYTPQSEVTSYIVEKIYSGYTNTTRKQDTTLKWRILNINDNGTIDLISEKDIEGLEFRGALGYNNGVYLLNNLCNTLYGNNACGATARSIKIEDIQDKMDLSVWDYHDYVDIIKYGETQTYDLASNSYYPYQWIQEKSEKNAVNGEFIKGTLGRSEQNVPTTATFSQLETPITVTQTYWKNELINTSNFKTVNTRNNQNDNNIYYNLFCTNGTTTNRRNYWLATRCADITSSRTEFGIQFMSSKGINAYGYLFYSTGPTSSIGGMYYYSHKICPIVTIPRTSLDLSVDYEETGIWEVK